MPKAQNVVSLHAQQARKAASRAQLALAQRMTRFSMAEFEAQRHVVDMIGVLTGLAMDMTVDVAIRRQCALDVIERADGKTATKIQIQHDVPQEDSSGATIEHEVASARAEANLLAEAEKWIGSGCDPAMWPDHVRERFGAEALAAFVATVEG
jgi:hypothetical protein